MEGLNYKWTKSTATGLYHFFRVISDTGTDTKDSICNSFRIGFYSLNPSDFVEEYEILDPSKICIKCKRFLDVKSHNKKIIKEVKFLPIQNNHVSKIVTCSEPGCKQKGVTFVSTIYPEKDHYCIDHNLRVQDTIKKIKVITQ